MKTPFLDYWSKRKERDEILAQCFKIKLTDAQLSTLHGDGDVRAALQRSRVASLLPPVGTEVFRRFTPKSLEQINRSSYNQKFEEDSLLKPAPELESEKTLPFFYGVPPPELRNIPLEDPDPFYQSQKTFVVVDKENTLSRFNAASSCFHFSPLSLFRRAAIKILNNKLFTALVCLTLVVNFFFMYPATLLGSILELVFLSIYTLEAALKILSRGFCLGRFTYLRDSWNRLDLVIIITGFVFYRAQGFLWCFKALRFLKILGLFPATRRNAKLFGRVLNRLWDVFLLTLLVLSVFSLLGTSLLSGSLKHKCVRLSWANISDDNSTDQYTTEEPVIDFWTHVNDKEYQYRMEGQLDPMVCGNSSTASHCPEGYTCLRSNTNPNYGFTNFDHFGFSFLASFRLMTRDFWENLALLVMQAAGKEMMIYFVVALFICSFSLTAFIVAAFTITFTEQTDREVREVKQDQKDYDKILAALKDKFGDELPEKKDPEQKISCWRRLCSCDCCGCWVRLKKGLQVFVLDPFFDVAIIILIVLNVCLMSSVHYPMSLAFLEVLLPTLLAFTFIFGLEVVLKILAMGPYEFFKVKWHYFDTILVILTVMDLGVADVEGFSVIRVASLLRLFRLGRWWPGLLKWMRLAWAGLRSLWFISLVIISMFFSMFGMFMFSESYQENLCLISEDCELPRWHWNSFFHSFMMTTRALCGEWIETLWDCLETSSDFVCVAFYIPLLIVGNFLLLTIVLTLLMKWISDKLAPEDEEKLKVSKRRIIDMLKVCGINAGGKAKGEERATANNKEDETLSCVTSELTEENGTQSSTLPIGEAQNFQKMKDTEDATEDPEDCCCQKCYSCCPSLNLDKSQGCGRVWANLRRAAFNIIQHPYFNNIIFFIILVSSFALMLEDVFLPLRSTLKAFLGYFDQVITYLFVLEVLFKWIGLGFHRYFRDGWCCLDLIVTLACVLSVAAQASSLNLFMISLKALRPLRILALIKGTKRSVCALLKMVPSLLNVLLVTLTVWLFFVIMFVDLYAGKFFYCFNETSSVLFPYDEVSNRTDCMMLMEYNFTEVRWKNLLFNFDNALEAYFSLFSVATFKGWLDILYSAVDSGRIEDQHVYEFNIYQYIWFVSFFLFGCFFCLIHILKTLFDAYSSQTKKMGGSHLFLTEKQMKKFDDTSFCLKRPLAPCPRPQGRLRGRLFDLVSRECFEWVMQGVILFGVVTMMIERDDMTYQEEVVLHWLNLIVVVIFLLEFILKICAFGRSYFRDNLNIIDFGVLILQILGLVIADIMALYFIHPSCLHLLRLGRLRRIIHRVPWALRLRLLYAAWTKSLSAIFNLALLLFVLMFTYASFGTFHFSQLRKAAFITDLMNFETFFSSLMCMFTVVTWGGWDGLIIPALYTPPDCTPAGYGEQGDCASPALAVAFFVSFLCLSSFVVLMALLVLLVDMLNVFGVMRCDPLSVLNLSCFFKAWRKFVPNSSHVIQRSQLPDLCDKLKKPLKIPKPTELDLELSPVEQVHCRDVLLALSVKALGDGADRNALKARIDEKYHEFMPNSPCQESCEMSNCAVEMNKEEAATPVTEDVPE